MNGLLLSRSLRLLSIIMLLLPTPLLQCFHAMQRCVPASRLQHKESPNTPDLTVIIPGINHFLVLHRVLPGHRPHCLGLSAARRALLGCISSPASARVLKNLTLKKTAIDCGTENWFSLLEVPFSLCHTEFQSRNSSPITQYSLRTTPSTDLSLASSNIKVPARCWMTVHQHYSPLGYDF